MKIYFKVQCIVSIAQEYSAHRPDQWTFLSARSAQILHYIHSPSVNRHISTSILWEKYGVVQGTSLTSCIHNVHLFWEFPFVLGVCVCVCVWVCGLMSFGLFGEQAFTMSGGYLKKKMRFSNSQSVCTWSRPQVLLSFFGV